MTIPRDSVVSCLVAPVVTRQYHFPSERLMAPPAEECSLEQLLEVAEQACRSASNLWALQGSSEHMRRICELLGTLNQRVAAQELELEAAHARIGTLTRRGVELDAAHTRLEAATRMLMAARDQTALVRHTLCAEVSSHRVTKLQVDQERELRLAAEEELRIVAGKLSRESDLHERSLQLCAQLRVEAISLRPQLAGTTPAAVQVALVRDALARGDEDEDETTVVDVPLAEEIPQGSACVGD